ncbi:MAG: acetylxylan esterase [Acidobacteriia bacterium]|nr:acetylxylan esterase [Terriglobia bacterium]
MRITALTLLCSIVLSPSLLHAQKQPPDPFLRWMDRIAQQQLDKRASVISAIRTVAEAERRKEWVRKTLLDILGGLPDYHGPLHARITGHIEADGYTIEKVIFESLPGFFVSADVYRPSQPGRYPGVLLQSGHTQEGKPEPQRLAANLALKGFVALAFDPIGQGEREQTYDPQLLGPAAGWSVPEHIQAGAQSLLLGEAVGRYFIWDAMRALDYLVSRSDVDSTRIGAAGCSGGGALTTFLGALDPRVKAVAPACYPNSYRLLFSGPDPDSEMSFPSFLERGLDVADFVELSAPTPWLIEATEEDYFTPAGAQLVFEEAQRWYRLYGAEDKLRFYVGPGPHGTPLASREAIYEWMIRWLNDGKGDFHEQPVRLYPNQDLWATRTGRVEDEPGSRKLYQLLLDDFHDKKKPGTTQEVLAELRTLGISSDGSSSAFQVLDEATRPWGRRQRIKFESEPGVEIEGILYLPDSPGRKPAVLALADKSPYFQAPTIDSLAERMAKAGRVVLVLEPRASVPEDADRPFLGDWLANSRANQIGRNLPAMRAHDILRGVDLLAARSDVDSTSIRALARGVRGIWLLLAAAADTRIKKIWLDRTPYSLRVALETTMNNDLLDAVIPGFALHWDLEDLTKAMENRSVIWTDPSNWMNRIVPLPSPFRYRYILGDTTDLSDEQNNAFVDELIK